MVGAIIYLASDASSYVTGQVIAAEAKVREDVFTDQITVYNPY